jgi:hypothetical protein
MNKFFFTILAISFAFFTANATDVKLKITYKGSGLSGHKVSVLVGGAAVGSGVTDGGGNVTISVSSLPSKRIDLKGEKKCNNAQKSWEANGYVELDGSNYGELKLDELTKMMAEGSGGFLSEETLAKSYGCICAGTSEESGDNSSTGSDASTEGNGIGAINQLKDAKQQREEQLAGKKSMYEQKLQNLDHKIEKKNKKLAEYDEKEKQEALYEIREWQIEKEMTQNDLERVNMQMSKKSMVLNKEEKEVYDDKEDALKEDMDALKADKKAGKTISEETVKASMAVVEKKESTKEEIKEKTKNEEEVEKEEEEEVEKAKVEVKEKSKKELEREAKEKEELAKEEEKRKAEELEKQKELDKIAEKERLKKEEEDKKLAEEEKAKAEQAAKEDLIYTPEEFANMSKSDLGKEKFGLSTDLSKLELKLKTRKNSMTPNELAEAEARKLKLEEAIKAIETEQEKRKAEKE